jgi:hypothetical protein
MTTIPFWIDSAPIKRFPAVGKNINVDVLVIGAGITGITTGVRVEESRLNRCADRARTRGPGAG